MTPQLVDRAHTDSCIVICCNLVQPRRKMNMFIAGRSHIAVASQLHIIHNCEQRDVGLFALSVNALCN